MADIGQTLSWIEKRIEQYLPLMTRIVSACTEDSKKVEGSRILLDLSLKWAFFLDFHAETGDQDYLLEAGRYNYLVYSRLQNDDRRKLSIIQKKIVTLFDYEKDIWSKTRSGIPPTEEEIMKYWSMKSGDALFYGKIIEMFTGKEATVPLHAYTQALDMALDIKEYEKDLTRGEPNMLAMKLAGHMPISQVPDTLEEAVRIAGESGIAVEIESMLDMVVHKTYGCDYGAFRFLKRNMDRQVILCRKMLRSGIDEPSCSLTLMPAAPQKNHAYLTSEGRALL